MLEYNEQKNPLVSVIIPCYNHVKYLEDCICSIMSQSYQNIEIVICDDCSTDGSWELLKSLEGVMQKRFSRVVLWRNEINKGIAKNVNGLLRAAQGNFIKHMASDDILLGNSVIQENVSYMIEHEDIDIVISNGIIIFENSHMPLDDKASYEEIYKVPPDYLQWEKDKLFELIYKENRIFAPGNMMRKEVIEKNGYYDEGIVTDDWEYWLRVIKNGKSKFGYLDKHLVAYRHGENSFSSSVYNEEIENRRIRLYQCENGVIEKYKEYVSPRLYAERKLKLLIFENHIAVKYKLKLLLRTTIKDYKKSIRWRDLSIRTKIYFIKDQLCGYIDFKGTSK